MSDQIMVGINFNVVKLDAWIEQRRRPDGDYDLIGMGRRTEYDHQTGRLVSDKAEPTGITGWAPREAVEGYRPRWWERLLGVSS